MRNPLTKVVALVMALAAVACNAPHAADGSGGDPVPKTRLSIATGPTGGVYYPYGGGIAKVISEHIPNVEATAEVTAASVDNLKFVRDHDTDIAFTTADTLAEAVNGTGFFKNGKLPLRALAVLYWNTTHLVTLASSPIQTVRDLKNRRVSTGAPGSGVEVTSFRILEASGINPQSDIKKQSLGVNESVNALKDGKIDAFFWNGGLPTAAILDLSHTPGIVIRMIPTDGEIESMKKVYGDQLYLRGIVPKKTYQGLESDVTVLNIPNLLVVHEDMDEKLAYDITRALFEHKPELVAIHPEARHLALASAAQGSPAAFHPGAIRYYEEQQVWPK
jgi:TRAP transporter TAXI family solute receptor